jgi:hypothetical protein
MIACTSACPAPPRWVTEEKPLNVEDCLRKIGREDFPISFLGVMAENNADPTLPEVVWFRVVIQEELALDDAQKSLFLSVLQRPTINVDIRRSCRWYSSDDRVYRNVRGLLQEDKAAAPTPIFGSSAFGGGSGFAAFTGIAPKPAGEAGDDEQEGPEGEAPAVFSCMIWCENLPPGGPQRDVPWITWLISHFSETLWEALVKMLCAFALCDLIL